MKISIVIVSYNQGEFLEETIKSAVKQTYQDKEIIIIDDGSTDNSIEIIKKYERHLHYWTRQKNAGQTSAISNGFKLCSGELIGWINSDDLLMPGALKLIADKARKVKSNRGVFFGGEYVIDAHGNPQDRFRYGRFNYFVAKKLGPTICQPGTFWGREAYNSVGGLDVKLKYGMDYDLFCRFLFAGVPFYYTGGYHGQFRRYPTQKGHSKHYLEIMRAEEAERLHKYGFDRVAKPARMLARALQISSRILNGYYINTLSYRLLRRRSIKEFDTSFSETSYSEG